MCPIKPEGDTTAVAKADGGLFLRLNELALRRIRLYFPDTERCAVLEGGCA